MSTIEVHVRMLPTKGESAWWTGPTHIAPKSRSDLTFPFSHVHNSCCSNVDLFRALAPLVSQVYQNSSNVTIMAYGQTGSGKTYTMVGEPGQHNGVFHLAADVLIREVAVRASAISQEFKDYISSAQTRPPSIISSVSKRKVEFATPPDIHTETAFGLRCAYLEIYNEQIRDLLQNPPIDVDIREGISREAVYLDKLSWHAFANIEALQELLVKGERARATTPTPLNIHSSRSHTILTIERVKLVLERSISKSEIVALRIERVPGQLHLVDLAGSECARLAATSGTHLREGGFINRSLLSLGNVVDAIVENRTHIPYRESKLTRILSNSLGLSKNSRTAVVCCINPDPANLEQSLAGLRFAQRASKVVVHPKVLGTQPPSCILQLLSLAKQSRSEGIGFLSQLHAAGLHDSTCISMRESKRYINLITHMFIDECNVILTEYRQATESVGCVLASKRDAIRAEIEEIQRQASYLKALGLQNGFEKDKLHTEVLNKEKEIIETKEREERERIAFESFNALHGLRSADFKLVEQDSLEMVKHRTALKQLVATKLGQMESDMKSEQDESEGLQRKHFIEANSQRLARKKCDCVNIEKADIEHRFWLLEETLSREKSKIQVRKTQGDHLIKQKERLAEIESAILVKRTKLNEIQQRAYRFISEDPPDKLFPNGCEASSGSQMQPHASEWSASIPSEHALDGKVSGSFMLNKDFEEPSLGISKEGVSPDDILFSDSKEFPNRNNGPKPMSVQPYTSHTEASAYHVRHTF